MRISKKILAAVLAALMVIAAMPFTALAVDAGASDIQAALNAGGNITLTEDLSSNISVPSGVSVVLDLNNHTVNAAITNNGTLTIKNGTVVKNGMYFPDMGFGTFAIMNNGVLTLENITCTGAIVNKSTAATPSMTINSGTYHGTPLAVASVSGSTTEINGGTFTDQGFVTAYSGSTIVFNDGSVSSVLGYGNGGSLEVNGGYVDTITPENPGDTPASVEINGGSFNAAYYDSDVKKFVDSSLNAVDNGDGTYSVVPAVTYVAQVGSTKYATLEEAIAAASEGDTITLIADLDFTCYPRATKHVINLTGKTLDLNGNTVTTYNHSVVFVGDNFTIKNGSFVCETDPNFTGWNPNNAYSVVIYPEDYNSVNDDVYDYSTGVVLENLNLVGGVNCYGSEVTLREVNASATYLNVKGTTYYAVWADTHTTVTVESGTYSSDSTSANAVVACNKDDASSTLTITGGDFTVKSGQNLTLTGNRLLSISGGTFTYENGSVYTVPAKYIAEGCSQDMETGTVSADYEDTMSIVVADNIDLNINLDTDDDRADTVEYTFSDPYSEGGETTTVTKSAKNDVTSFTVALSPAQVMDDITAVVKDENGDVVREVTTSIADYCNTIIESVTTEVITEELKDLAKSTLDYGKAASAYFDYNTEAAWAEENYLADPSDEINALADAAKSGNWFDTNIMHVTSATYRATSKPELRFYISETLAQQNYLGDLVLTSNIGKAEFVKNEDGTAMLRIKDIDITDFGKQIVVQYSYSDYDTYKYDLLTFTPVTWVNSAIGKDGELGALAKGIGNYYLASVAYFGA